jgi:D-alanine transaminase
MPRFAYVNGEYLSHSEAGIHIEDRGFQFADSVYEVIACINGTLADERGHMDRLERSLAELGMPMPHKREVFGIIIRNLLRKNRVNSANVYIQVSRGVAKRDFKFPTASTPQSVVITTHSNDFTVNPYIDKGAKAITVPDIRWARRDIKTTGLLAQSLAKQAAAEKGAQEALMIDENGYITEGSSSNCWMVKGKVLYTRKANHNILKGITRTAIWHVAEKNGLKIKEKTFKPSDLYKADEVFNTSATAVVMPFVNIDGKKIGSGKTGPIARMVYEEYLSYVKGKYGKQLKWKY